MRIQSLALPILLASLGCSDQRPEEPSFDYKLPIAVEREWITAEALNEIIVIGALHFPLGQALEINATIVSGDELRRMGYAGRYLLRVESVNGQLLEDPPTLLFWDRFSDRLPNDHFALYELKHGRKATTISSSEIPELENGYVGRAVKLVAYEAGRFDGRATALPQDIRPWGGALFHFSTHLVVLKLRE